MCVHWPVLTMYWQKSTRGKKKKTKTKKNHSFTLSLSDQCCFRTYDWTHRKTIYRRSERTEQQKKEQCSSFPIAMRSINRSTVAYLIVVTFFSLTLSLSFSLHFYIELANTYHKSTLRTRTKSLSIHKIVKLQKKTKDEEEIFLNDRNYKKNVIHTICWRFPWAWLNFFLYSYFSQCHLLLLHSRF